MLSQEQLLETVATFNEDIQQLYIDILADSDEEQGNLLEWLTATLLLKAVEANNHSDIDLADDAAAEEVIRLVLQGMSYSEIFAGIKIYVDKLFIREFVNLGSDFEFHYPSYLRGYLSTTNCYLLQKDKETNGQLASTVAAAGIASFLDKNILVSA